MNKTFGRLINGVYNFSVEGENLLIYLFKLEASFVDK